MENQKEEIAEFGVGDLYAVGMTLVVLGIGIAYGQSILTDTKNDMAECSSTYAFNSATGQCANQTCTTTACANGLTYPPNNIEWNSTVKTQDAVAKIPNKLGLLVTVIIAAVILGVLTRYLIVSNQAN